MLSSSKGERLSLRRDGNVIYTVLKCRCGDVKRFTATFDELDQRVTKLFKPIDKINADIDKSGWTESPSHIYDRCPVCAILFPYPVSKRRGKEEDSDGYWEEVEDE